MIASGSIPSEMLTNFFVRFCIPFGFHFLYERSTCKRNFLHHLKGFFWDETFSFFLCRADCRRVDLSPPPFLWSSRAICEAANWKWFPITLLIELSYRGGRNLKESFSLEPRRSDLAIAFTQSSLFESLLGRCPTSSTHAEFNDQNLQLFFVVELTTCDLGALPQTKRTKLLLHKKLSFNSNHWVNFTDFQSIN